MSAAVAAPSPVHATPYAVPGAGAQPSPAPFDPSVKGPSVGAAPVVVDNPLTEARGAAGWLAIGIAAASALLYFISGSALLVSLAVVQGGVIVRVVAALLSYASVGLFAWSSVGLFRRRSNAYRLVMGAHAVWLSLVVLGVFVQVMVAGEVHWIVFTPSVIVITHILGISFAYAARGVFWIRT
jgi:hypothetical protein